MTMRNAREIVGALQLQLHATSSSHSLAIAKDKCCHDRPRCSFHCWLLCSILIGYCTDTLGLPIAGSRSYSCPLSPKGGVVYALGALEMGSTLQQVRPNPLPRLWNGQARATACSALGYQGTQAARYTTITSRKPWIYNHVHMCACAHIHAYTHGLLRSAEDTWLFDLYIYIYTYVCVSEVIQTNPRQSRNLIIIIGV